MRAEPNLEGELPRLITKLWLDLSSQPQAVTGALARRWGTPATVAALWSHACAEAAAAWRAGDAEARAARWGELADQQREAALAPPPGELEVIAQLATSYVEGRFPRREARERVAAALAALIGGSYQPVLAAGEDSPAGDVEPDMTTPTAATATIATEALVETMPDQYRSSHRAAGNWGVYPHNGAERAWMSLEEAEEVVASDPDGYARIIRTR